MTRVVNINREPYDVYIGRAGKGQDGYFGNPIQFNEKCPECGRIHKDNSTGREELVECYRYWFWRKIKNDPEFKRRIEELKGKTLGCFCKPKPCHGDIIAFYLEFYAGSV